MAAAAKEKSALVSKNGKPKKWIYAKIALDLMIEAQEDPAAAKAALAEAMAMGRVRTRARFHWISMHKSLNKAWSQRPGDADEKRNLQKKYWKPLRKRDEDRVLWRWEKNRFHTTLASGRRMMEGVQFRVEDLKTLFPSVYGPATKKRKHGPDKDLQKIHSAWRTVLELALDPEEPWQGMGKQGDLADEVYERANAGKTKAGSTKVGMNKVQDVARVAWPLIDGIKKRGEKGSSSP